MIDDQRDAVTNPYNLINIHVFKLWKLDISAFLQVTDDLISKLAKLSIAVLSKLEGQLVNVLLII